MMSITKHCPRSDEQFGSERPRAARRRISKRAWPLRGALRGASAGTLSCLLAIATPASGCGRLGYDRVPLQHAPDASLADAGSDGGLGRRVLQVDAGYRFTCALDSEGVVSCWGQNETCQLGREGGLDSPWPEPVEGADDATAVAAGGRHACILRSSGDVACWGYNRHGQLGVAATTTQSCSPTTISGVRDIVAIASGHDHVCALSELGQLLCWGRNYLGQLGDGTQIDHAMATPVGPADTVAVVAGHDFTCRLTESGRVECWGQDAEGQVGAGSASPADFETRPLRVLELAEVRQIVTGEQHACALGSSADVSCWGYDNYGQLGDGAVEPSRSWPAPAVVDLTGVEELAAGDEHTCARLSNGTVTCWGAGSYGQLGDGTLTNRPLPVTTALGIDDAVAITSGKFHTCALRASGEAWCWGWNAEGQIGTGETSDTPVAAPIPVEL